MRVLARKGYAETTLSEVAAEAGVSYGLVSFYFDSKESLLTQTLLSMSEEYRENWSDALARAGADPAERLWAMLGADFNDAICTRDHIACWCAFWGEVQPKEGRLLTPARAINHTDEELEYLARLVNQRTAWQIAGKKGVKDGRGYMDEKPATAHPAAPR